MQTQLGRFLILIAAAALLAACGGGGDHKNADSYTVPNVVGMTQSAAATAIVNAGLTVGSVTSAASSTVPAGQVTTQNPAPGTVMAVGSAVSFEVSLGPPGSVVVSIAVTPASASIAKGSSMQFQAVATYADGHTADVSTSVAWSSSAPAVASVSTTGMVTGLAAGNAEISAREGVIVARSNVIVTAATVASIAVSPATATISTGGAPQQFVATGTLTDGTVADVTTSASWTVDLYTCASVTVHGGLVTGTVGAGDCSIKVQATMGTISGAAQATVTGLFAPAKYAGIGVYRPFGVAIGGLNSDARPDLVVASTFKVELWVGIGDGTFGAASTLPDVPGSRSPVIADFNGDGASDVAAVSGGAVNRWMGDGIGGFGDPSRFPVGLGAVHMTASDLNSDGRPDLAVANESDGTVSILLGDAAGSFGPASSHAVGAGPKWVAVADFNGDGAADLAMATYPSNSVAILLGTGTGSFGAPTSVAVPGSPTSVAAAELNGDGKPDLAVTHGSTVSVLLGDGTGSFQSAGAFALGDNGRFYASCVVVADFNLDGKQDLAASNTDAMFGPSLAVLLGAGTGSFGTAMGVPFNQSPNFLAVGDLNSDGKPDLVASDDGSVGSVFTALHQ